MVANRLPSSVGIAHPVIQPVKNNIGMPSGGMNNFNGLFTGRVIRVDPGNNTVDIKLMAGGIMHQVPVAQKLAGTMEGEYCLPNIKTPKKKEDKKQQQGQQQDQNPQQGQTQQQAGTQEGQQSEEGDDSDGRVDWKDIEDADLSTQYERDTWAVVGYMQGSSRNPICLGFFFPHSTQMSIKARQEDKEDRIDYMRRLTSHAYELRTRGGVSEDNYPDGTHVRVGKPHKDGGGSQSGQSQQQAGTPGDPTQSSDSSSQSSGGGDDYYDDDSGDPDARIKLGDGEYENIDKDDKPWKIKKTDEPFRWFVVHSSKTKLGIDENGRIHNQYYKNKDQESDAPDPTGDDGTNKFNHAHTDHHQTRVWRVGFGDPKDAPGPEDKVMDGEDWYDPTNNRNRYHLPEVSDGTYHACNCGSGSGGSAGDGASSGPMAAPGFGGGSQQTYQNGSSGVPDFPPHTGEVNFTNQVGQSGGLHTGSDGNYFPFATTDGHKISFGDHHHGEGPGAIDVLTGQNGRFIAPTSGYVTSTGGPGGSQGAGVIVTLHGDNGIDYNAGHVSPLTSGRVTGGTAIGAVGALGSTGPFGAGSGKEDLLHGHYFITQRGQGISPSGLGSINPYTGGGGVSGLRDTVMSNGGEAGSPQGTFGSMVDPQASAGDQPAEEHDTSNEEVSEEPQTKWYMPAAVPKGGGVPKKVKGVKAKASEDDQAAAGETGEGSATGSELQEDHGEKSDDDSGSTDGVLIDAAAADHEHKAFVADDDEIKDTADENKGGKSENLARGDHEHKDKDSSSDERFKNNLGVLREVLPALRELNVIKFTWNELGRINGEQATTEQIGLVAQEVNQYFPELITYDSKGYLHLNYKKLGAVLLKGLQETNQRIDRIEQMLGI